MDPTQQLQSVLNKSDYNLINPANNFVYPGGLLVADNKHASFWGLPAAVAKPDTADFQAAWPKEELSKSFSLAAAISALLKVFSGGASVNHTSQLTLDQLNAAGKEVQAGALDSLITNPAIVAKVKSWLADPAHYRVYFVSGVLASTSISISTSSGTSVAGAFLTSVPTCNPPAGGSASSTGGSASSTGGSGSGRPPRPQVPPQALLPLAALPGAPVRRPPLRPSPPEAHRRSQARLVGARAQLPAPLRRPPPLRCRRFHSA